jgi:pimeloyl-ACP methyl ester carboxylesterase
MERIEFAGSDVTLVADAAGDPGGRPVLFLHGGGQTRQSWGRAIAEAASRGFRAYAIDARGHGESGWSPDRRYGIDDFADDLRAVIRTLDRRPVLVGASMGGMTGLIVAAFPPPEVAGLVLVDIAAQVEETGIREITDFMKSAPNGFASLDEAADMVAAYLPHRPRPRDNSGLMRNLRKRDDGRLYWHWDPAFISPPHEQETLDVTTDLLEQAARALRVPTLLVRGGRSRVVSKEGAEAFRKLAPHAELADVAEADHMVAGDANDKFNAIVFSFLERIPADA